MGKKLIIKMKMQHQQPSINKANDQTKRLLIYRIIPTFFGIVSIGIGVSYMFSVFDPQNTDRAVATIWAVTCLLTGASLLLRLFNTTLSKLLGQMSQTKAVRLIAKIIFWGTIISIGFLVLVGGLSLIAGLSATTIITVLLVLILLELRNIKNR